MQKDTTTLNIRRRRLKNALLGLFIGDALAMPAHWYYNPENIVKVFNGGISGYVDPPHPHLESFIVGMTYNPDLEIAKRLGRDYDILHEHARFATPAIAHSTFKARIGKTSTETWFLNWGIDQLIRKHSESEVIKHVFATACYPEHGLPLLLYLAKCHNVDVESALLANANAGGDSVHRGMILGLVIRAASDDLPEHLRHGLIAWEELRKEVEEFSDIALSGKGI